MPVAPGYWMRQSGLADLFPSLSKMVYVGLSAGSLVMAPHIGEEFIHWKPPTGGNELLGLVDFVMFPHLDHPALPENTMAHAEKWAANLTVPGYAMPIQLWVQAARARLRIRELPVGLIYNDPSRHFGGLLDDPKVRVQHYLDVLERELACPAIEPFQPCERKSQGPCSTSAN